MHNTMTKKKTIHIVPHSHYDVVWAFCKEDYYKINEIILEKAIEMIKKYDFRFLVEQTHLLEMIEEKNPKLFTEIKEAIKADKIEIADGEYIMADPMIPIGEILVREIVWGKRYCQEKFGKNVEVAWAADGFGLNAQMPQVYKKSGYSWLAFRRGIPRLVGHRVSEFIWIGLDGSKILSHWLPKGYRAGLELDKWEQSYRTLANFATTSHILMPCGSGGVPPQMDTPEKIQQWNATHSDSRMVVTVPSAFFRNMEKEAGELAEYHGELYSPDLENVFPDVVSSRIGLKLAHKKCENSLITIEKLATLAWIQGKPYPASELQKMWKGMLFLVDHDVISACGIDEIYDEAWEKIIEINEQSEILSKDLLSYLAGSKGLGNDILVFNPNNWEVTDWVEINAELDAKLVRDAGIVSDGIEVPCEVLESANLDKQGKCTAKIGFIATAPPLGFRRYSIIEGHHKFTCATDVHDNEVENRFFRMIIDKKTGIISVYDKGCDKQILVGNEIIIDQEIGDLYFHKSEFNEPIGTEGGEGIHFSTFVPGKFSIKKGPARTVITFENSFFCLQWPYYLTEKFGSIFQRHNTIDIRKEVFVYDDLPRIGFRTTINSRQSHIRLRVKFDTCMVVPRYTRQTQFGVIDIPLAKTLEESVRFPSLNWLNCQEGHHGIAFFSRGVPVNEVKAGNVFYTLLRSVSVLSTDGKSGPLIPTPEAMELGEYVYSYAVYPHGGDWQNAGIHQRGHEFNHRLIAVQTDCQNMRSGLNSFILQPDNLVVSALKQSEKGDSVVLRFFETRGEECTAVLSVPSNIQSAQYVNLLEEEPSPLSVHSGKLEMTVHPFEIVTLELLLDNK